MSRGSTKKSEKTTNVSSLINAKAESIWGTKDSFSIVLFILLLVTLFYPSFFRGLFFDENLLPSMAWISLLFIVFILDQWRKKTDFINSYSDIGMLVYFMAYMLAVTTAVMPRKAIIGAMLGLAYFAVYWMTHNAVENHKQLRIVTDVLILSAVGVVIVTLDAALGGPLSGLIGVAMYPSAYEAGRLYTTFQYPNAGGAYLGAFLVLTIVRTIESGKVLERAIYLAAAALLAMGLIGTVSKGAILIALFGLFLLFVLAKKESRFQIVIASGLSLIVGAVSWKLFIKLAMLKSTWSALLILVGLVLIAGALAYVWTIIEARVAELDASVTKKAKLGMVVLAIFCVIALASTWRIWVPQDIATRMQELANPSNQSYLTRIDFARWALEIMKDHPIVGAGYGGWNGLYQRYQDYQYWTTETHSHFLQVGVEAGLLGLIAYLGVWILHILRIRRSQKEDNLMLLGVGVAGLVLFIHSSFDFDFSIPAMQMIAWSLVAIMATLSLDNEAKPEINHKSKYLPWLFAALSVLVFVNSIRMYDAKVDLDRYKDLIKAKNFQQAVDTLNTAITEDPWSVESRVTASQLYFSIYQSTKDKKYYDEAERLNKEAEALALNDVRMITNVGMTYAYLGDYEGSLRVNRQRVNMVPLDGTGYETLGWSLVEAAKMAGYKGDYVKMKQYAQETLDIPKLMKKNTAHINPTRYSVWVGTKPVITSKLQYYFGVANFLLGHYDQTKETLPKISTSDQTVANEAMILQAAVYKTENKNAEAESIINKVYQQDENARFKLSLFTKIAEANKKF